MCSLRAPRNLRYHTPSSVDPRFLERPALTLSRYASLVAATRRAFLATAALPGPSFHVGGLLVADPYAACRTFPVVCPTNFPPPCLVETCRSAGWHHGRPSLSKAEVILVGALRCSIRRSTDIPHTILGKRSIQLPVAARVRWQEQETWDATRMIVSRAGASRAAFLNWRNLSTATQPSYQRDWEPFLVFCVT